MGELFDLKAKLKVIEERLPPPPVDPPGGGGDDGGMDGERIARLEAVIPTLATRSDVAELKIEVAGLRSEVYKAISEQTWKVVGACGLLAAAAFFAGKYLH